MRQLSLRSTEHVCFEWTICTTEGSNVQRIQLAESRRVTVQRRGVPFEIIQPDHSVDVSQILGFNKPLAHLLERGGCQGRTVGEQLVAVERRNEPCNAHRQHMSAHGRTRTVYLPERIASAALVEKGKNNTQRTSNLFALVLWQRLFECNEQAGKVQCRDANRDLEWCCRPEVGCQLGGQHRHGENHRTHVGLDPSHFLLGEGQCRLHNGVECTSACV